MLKIVILITVPYSSYFPDYLEIECHISTFTSNEVAPMKALCSERFVDWKTKFEPFGLKCKEVTGDSELDDYYELQNTHVIMTTPVSLMLWGKRLEELS